MEEDVDADVAPDGHFDRERHVRRAIVAHIRQSRPDPGLGFTAKVLNTF